MRQIVWFDDYTEQDRGAVGGKNASLGAMTAAGLDVPPGFAVTTDAFEASLSTSGCLERACAELESLNVRDLSLLAPAAARARRMVELAALTDEATKALAAAYGVLAERTGQADVPVAVRSSASCEDLAASSGAGQQDTELWVRGASAVALAVRRCWASLFNDRAVAYRAEAGIAQAAATIAVGVQQMVVPKAAGVAFTLDPSNGDRSKVVVESVFGLGEGVASGSVTPDHFVVDKVVSEIVHRRISTKEREFVVDKASDTVVARALDASRGAQPSLTDDEVLAVVDMANRVERHFDRPQDVEWALVTDRPDRPDRPDRSGQASVVVLQARPETVWSNRPRRRVSSGRVSLTDGMLATLLKPTKVGGPT